MVKKTTELAKPITSDYALVNLGTEGMTEMLAENVEDADIGERDLPRAKIPAGGMTVFERGNDAPKELVGVIVCKGQRRVYWEEKYGQGESGPPDCYSLDGKRGIGSIAEQHGGNCKTCPMAQFGTATDDKGQPGKGQACAQRQALYIMLPEEILPTVLSLPPTSVQAFKHYMVALTSKQRPFYAVVTKITLVKDRNAGGVDFATAVFETVENVPDDQIPIFRGMGEICKKHFVESIMPTVEGN